MNPPTPGAVPRFFCYIHSKVEGPFDLIELAGQLRLDRIDANTPVRNTNVEEWCALHELPEYGAVQDISIEAIARHLHEKEQSAGSPRELRKTTSPLRFVWLPAVGLAVLLGALGYFTKTTNPAQANVPVPSPPSSPTAEAKPTPPPAPFPEPWPETTAAAFSIKCPLVLKPQPRSGSGDTVTYEASTDKITFGVEVTHLPDLSDAEYDQVIQRTRDDFVTERQFRIISERKITGPGYRGIEIGCVVPPDPRTEYGRMRLVQGNQSLILTWVIADPEDFSPENRTKFLTSLVVR